MAHKETSAHDYQGWLQARPIREDIKKYFDLVLFSKCSRVDFHQDYCKDFKIKAENLNKIFAENSGRKGFSLFQSQAPSEIWRES